MTGDTIAISQINDFLYSPASLYMHTAYHDYRAEVFKSRDQINGTIKHERLDKGIYSTRKEVLSGKMVYSHRFNLIGKIDIFNTKTGELIERKARIKRVYTGYRYQLYAQMFALEDMGYTVNELTLHSLEDNKSYDVPLPTTYDEYKFAQVLDRMRDFDPRDLFTEHADERAMVSIYAPLGW